jgi:outer membrane receptor protein involved in Fe transport
MHAPFAFALRHRASLALALTALAPATAPAQTAADLPASSPSTAVGTVVVTAQKLSVETKIDRKVYAVAGDAQSAFGTASDILNVIPSVDVDADGVVSLRGDTNVLVLIDGKPSTRFQGSAAGENLQSLSAADIERIEVLTTPPPQYKAEGAAGVINIITRKRHALGASGTVQGSLGNGGRYVAATNLRYATRRGSVSMDAGFRQDYRDRRVDSLVIGQDPGSRQVLDNRSGFAEHQRRQVPSAGLSGDYALDDRDSVSATASWSSRGGLRTYVQRNSSADSAGVVTSSTGRNSSGHDPENAYDAALRFTHKLSRTGETLDLSLHRSISHQHEHYDYANESFIPVAPDFSSNLSFTEDHGITEANADYVLPLGNSRTVKLGYDFEQDDYGFRNVGGNVDPVTGAITVDPNLTNDFRFHQRIDAGYGSFQVSVGDWTWLGGLRAELTSHEALLVTDGTRTDRHYFEVFPSLHVDRALTEHSTLSFGASRRIARPQPDNLNPYLDHEYTPNLKAGNPDLRPQITQSFDLGIELDRRTASYQLTAYYRRNNDSVTDLIEYLGNGFSLATKENLPRNDSAGLEFSATRSVAKWLSCSVSGDAFFTQIDATQLGTPGLRSTTGVDLKVKLDVRPTVRDSVQFFLTRTDARLTAQGTVSAIDLVNLGYKRSLTAALTLVGTVSDAFNGQRFERYTSTPTLTQTYQRSTAGRIAFVGMVYAFGAAGKSAQAKFDYDQEP